MGKLIKTAAVLGIMVMLNGCIIHDGPRGGHHGGGHYRSHHGPHHGW